MVAIFRVLEYLPIIFKNHKVRVVQNRWRSLMRLTGTVMLRVGAWRPRLVFVGVSFLAFDIVLGDILML
ncbi:hypothetical protein BC567DRAFT_219445 [Phyllosticta citribraziliensis]